MEQNFSNKTNASNPTANRSSPFFNQLKTQYPEEQFSLISNEANNALKNLNSNISDSGVLKSSSYPIELGLYNDQENVNHPFIADIGAHEMRLANNYTTLTNEYVNNMAVIMDNVLHSFIENSKSAVRNKINSFTYSSEYNEFFNTIFGQPKKNNFIANHQSTTMLYRAIKGHEPQKSGYTLGNLSSSYIYNAVKLGMILDYNTINQFVDCHRESGTPTPEFFKMFITELKNVENFAKIKIAEHNILRFYEPIIKKEITTHKYRIVNQIIDASNMMYFLLDQTQNYCGYFNPDFEKEYEDLPIFYSLFNNPNKSITPVLDNFLTTLKLKGETPEDKFLLDYITIPDNFKNEILNSLSPDNLKKLNKDGDDFTYVYQNPYDEDSIKIAQSRMTQCYLDLKLNDIITGITPTDMQTIIIPTKANDFEDNEDIDAFPGKVPFENQEPSMIR